MGTPMGTPNPSDVPICAERTTGVEPALSVWKIDDVRLRMTKSACFRAQSTAELGLCLRCAWAHQWVHLERGSAMADRKRSEEHTSELQSLMRISYAVFCLTKKKKNTNI